METILTLPSQRMLVCDQLMDLLSNQDGVGDASLPILTGKTVLELEALFNGGYPKNRCALWPKMQMYAIHYVGNQIFQTFDNEKQSAKDFLTYLLDYKEGLQLGVYLDLFHQVSLLTTIYREDFPQYFRIAKEAVLNDTPESGRPGEWEAVVQDVEIIRLLQVVVSHSFLSRKGSRTLLSELLKPVFKENTTNLISLMRTTE